MNFLYFLILRKTVMLALQTSNTQISKNSPKLQQTETKPLSEPLRTKELSTFLFLKNHHQT